MMTWYRWNKEADTTELPKHILQQFIGAYESRFYRRKEKKSLTVVF